MDDTSAAPEYTPDKRLANLRPPWTSEEAREAGAKSRKTKRVYSLRGALAKRLKAKRPDGTRPWDDALAGFVEKLMSGDPRAIELAMDAVDGKQESVKKHVHAVSRELVIRAKPAPVIEAASPAELPQASDAPQAGSEPRSDNA